jgi:hypothetical protein
MTTMIHDQDTIEGRVEVRQASSCETAARGDPADEKAVCCGYSE